LLTAIVKPTEVVEPITPPVRGVISDSDSLSQTVRISSKDKTDVVPVFQGVVNTNYVKQCTEGLEVLGFNQAKANFCSIMGFFFQIVKGKFQPKGTVRSALEMSGLTAKLTSDYSLYLGRLMDALSDALKGCDDFTFVCDSNYQGNQLSHFLYDRMVRYPKNFNVSTLYSLFNKMLVQDDKPVGFVTNTAVVTDVLDVKNKAQVNMPSYVSPKPCLPVYVGDVALDKIKKVATFEQHLAATTMSRQIGGTDVTKEKTPGQRDQFVGFVASPELTDQVMLSSDLAMYMSKKYMLTGSVAENLRIIKALSYSGWEGEIYTIVPTGNPLFILKENDIYEVRGRPKIKVIAFRSILTMSNSVPNDVPLLLLGSSSNVMSDDKKTIRVSSRREIDEALKTGRSFVLRVRHIDGLLLNADRVVEDKYNEIKILSASALHNGVCYVSKDVATTEYAVSHYDLSDGSNEGKYHYGGVVWAIMRAANIIYRMKFTKILSVLGVLVPKMVPGEHGISGEELKGSVEDFDFGDEVTACAFLPSEMVSRLVNKAEGNSGFDGQKHGAKSDVSNQKDKGKEEESFDFEDGDVVSLTKAVIAKDTGV